MILKSLTLYPLPYSRSEVGTSFERPKRLVVNFLRLVGLKSIEERRPSHGRSIRARYV
jgi:hypothetical protein